MPIKNAFIVYNFPNFKNMGAATKPTIPTDCHVSFGRHFNKPNPNNVRRIPELFYISY